MERFLFNLFTYLDGIIGGIVGGIVGGVFVHRLNLRRDKRKEFNDIAQPIRVRLLNERKGPSVNQRGGLRDSDVEQLESVLPWWRKRRFRKTWNAYEQSKLQFIDYDAMGGPSYKTVDEIVKQIDRLLRYTKRK